MANKKVKVDSDTLEEMQMITGTISNDITYLYYKMIRDGSYFRDIEAPKHKISGEAVSDFETWFDSL